MLIIHDIIVFKKYYGMNIFTMRQLKTTVGLEIGTYADFRRLVQATEAKRLEKWHISDNTHFSVCFKLDLGRRTH